MEEECLKMTTKRFCINIYVKSQERRCITTFYYHLQSNGKHKEINRQGIHWRRGL